MRQKGENKVRAQVRPCHQSRFGCSSFLNLNRGAGQSMSAALFSPTELKPLSCLKSRGGEWGTFCSFQGNTEQPIWENHCRAFKQLFHHPLFLLTCT